MGMLIKLGSFWNTEQRNLLAVFGAYIKMLDSDVSHDYDYAKASAPVSVCPWAAGRHSSV